MQGLNSGDRVVTPRADPVSADDLEIARNDQINPK